MILINQPSQSLLWLCQYSGGKLSTVRLLTAAASSGSEIDVQRPAEADEDNLCHSCPKEWRRQDICSDTKEMIKFTDLCGVRKWVSAAGGDTTGFLWKGVKCGVTTSTCQEESFGRWNEDKQSGLKGFLKRSTLCRHWYALYPASTL